MIETVRLAEFLPYVWPHAPGAPQPTIETALRQSAIEFCERTRCWRHITEVHFYEQNDAPVIAPQFSTIQAFEFAVYKPHDSDARIPLTPTQFSDLARNDFGPGDDAQPAHITQATPNSVTIFPFNPGTVEISCFLKPRFGMDMAGFGTYEPLEDRFNVVPEFLLSQWGEAIACGALSKILLVPQQRWTDPQRAAYFLGRFERYCDQHFSSNLTGQQRAPRRSRFSFV